MKPFPRSDINLVAAADALRNGRLTATALLEQCLDAIRQKDDNVRAWVMVDEEAARRRARQLDESARAGRFHGILHGIPIAVKDIIDVADLPTRFGTTTWSDEPAKEDATIVARLRAAGAVILGKTVTTAYASFDPPPTRNPRNLRFTPGGSSSGSAAALAAGMCVGALGTQTGGSLTRPASYCGVACIKPTFGRVSLHGILPLAPSMDHAGVMARTVRETAILFDTVAGPDPRDPTCSWQPFTLCAPRLKTVAPPPRIGALGGMFHDLAAPVMREAFSRHLDQLRRAGAEVCELVLPTEFTDILKLHRAVMVAEAAAWHRERFERLPEAYPPRFSSLLREGLELPATQYIDARQTQPKLREELLRCFEGLDALLAPATTGPAPEADSTGDPAFNSPWSYLGLPAISYPVALSEEGLPLAVQFIGRPFGEADLFAAAAFGEAAAATP